MSDRLTRPDGKPPRVLVIGGGVAALELVLALRAHAGMRVELEVIAPHRELRYPPLDVVEPFGLAPPHVDLADALAAAGARFRLDTVDDVDVGDRHLHTGGGAVLHYEALVLAVGARRLPAMPGTIAFGDEHGRAAFADVLRSAEDGHVEQLLFAVPPGLRWSLPLYELAVMTARRLAGAPAAHTHIAIATPEHAPLELFGGRASGRLLEYLEELGIAFLPGGHVDHVVRGAVRLAPSGRRVPADRVITLPALRGPAFPGIPHDAAGFIPVDAHGAVRGEPDVYAAGDATDFPIKHGGLATQQADAVAEAIAARTGALVRAQPFRPVLRGMLLTSETPHYLEADIAGGGVSSSASAPLWWPPAKVAGRYLAPFLAERLGTRLDRPVSDAPWGEGTVPCEISLPAS